MGWSLLATQFCLELGFGVLVALAFVPTAPVGRLFYRMMGTTAMLPIAAAAGAPWLVDEGRPDDPVFVCAVLALLAWPLVAGSAKGRVWGAALAWSLTWCGAALVFTVSRAGHLSGVGEIALGSLSAMATGAVAGSVALAMVLGHWYLTVPKLDVRWLGRLNRVTVVSMGVSLLLLLVTCVVFADELNAAQMPLLGPWGLFYFGTRVTVGLLLPLLFAWMTAGSLKFSNTRSATGILYASTILVLIGTAAAVSLQDSYGVPL